MKSGENPDYVNMVCLSEDKSLAEVHRIVELQKNPQCQMDEKRGKVLRVGDNKKR